MLGDELRTLRIGVLIRHHNQGWQHRHFCSVLILQQGQTGA